MIGFGDLERINCRTARKRRIYLTEIIMKIKSIAAILIVFGVLFNANAAFALPGTKTVKIDKTKFVQNVKGLLDGNVKGYQAFLLKNGQLVAEVADGEARNKADGLAEMTVNTPSNIGSTAKFFAGVALLKFFETPKNNLNPTGKTVDEWLDTRIFSYLPQIWQDTAHRSWRLVTFRELLQHKSGLRNFTKAELDDYAAKGIKVAPYLYFTKELKPENRNSRVYANFNFTILTFLLPVLSSNTLLTTVNLEVAKQKLKPDDLYITQTLGKAFYGHMLVNSFGKVAPKISPSCDAPNEYPAKNVVFAKAYNSAADAGKGFEWSEKVAHGSCFAQGGWYLSGRELAAFVANFAATEKLLSNETKAKMYDGGKWDDRLVWSNVYTNKWITDNLGVSRMPGMDGLQDGYRSVLIKMPDDYYALAIINSADLNTPDLARVLLASFSDAASF